MNSFSIFRYYPKLIEYLTVLKDSKTIQTLQRLEKHLRLVRSWICQIKTAEQFEHFENLATEQELDEAVIFQRDGSQIARYFWKLFHSILNRFSLIIRLFVFFHQIKQCKDPSSMKQLISELYCTDNNFMNSTQDDSTEKFIILSGLKFRVLELQRHHDDYMSLLKKFTSRTVALGFSQELDFKQDTVALCKRVSDCAFNMEQDLHSVQLESGSK